MATLDEELKALQPVPTRFERLMSPGNFLDQILALEKKTKGTDQSLKTVLTAEQRKPRAVGSIAKDPQYEAELHFADMLTNRGGAPDSHQIYWTEPLVSPTPSTPYYVRVRIAQHQVEPQLQGFKLHWYKPDSWTWIDGLGAVTYEEAISNPLSVVRVVRSAGSIAKVNFRVVVEQRYFA